MPILLSIISTRVIVGIVAIAALILCLTLIVVYAVLNHKKLVKTQVAKLQLMYADSEESVNGLLTENNQNLVTEQLVAPVAQVVPYEQFVAPVAQVVPYEQFVAPVAPVVPCEQYVAPAPVVEQPSILVAETVVEDDLLIVTDTTTSDDITMTAVPIVVDKSRMSRKERRKLERFEAEQAAAAYMAEKSAEADAAKLAAEEAAAELAAVELAAKLAADEAQAELDAAAAQAELDAAAAAAEIAAAEAAEIAAIQLAADEAQAEIEEAKALASLVAAQAIADKEERDAIIREAVAEALAEKKAADAITAQVVAEALADLIPIEEQVYNYNVANCIEQEIVNEGPLKRIIIRKINPVTGIAEDEVFEGYFDDSTATEVSANEVPVKTAPVKAAPVVAPVKVAQVKEKAVKAPKAPIAAKSTKTVKATKTAKAKKHEVPTFAENIAGATDKIKAIYNDIKNEIMSYSGIKSSITKKGETFKHDGELVAKLIFDEKLILGFAVEPKLAAYYDLATVSNDKAFELAPVTFVLKSKSAVKQSESILKDMSSIELGIKKKVVEIDYATEVENEVAEA